MEAEIEEKDLEKWHKLGKGKCDEQEVKDDETGASLKVTACKVTDDEIRIKMVEKNEKGEISEQMTMRHRQGFPIEEVEEEEESA